MDLSTVDETRVDEVPAFEFLDTIQLASTKAADRGARIPSAYVYVIEADGLGLFKIGRSNDAVARLGSYKTECPVTCHPIMFVRVCANDADHIERYLHRHFQGVRHRGEWFRLTREHVKELRPLVAEAAAKGLKALDRDLSRMPVIYDSEQVSRGRAIEAQIKAATVRNAVPTGELIVDRIAYLGEMSKVVTMLDVIRQIDRRPRIIHQAMRCIILEGKVAFRSPRRHPRLGTVRLEAYRYCGLMVPDASCEWEDAGFGEEILVSEPFGHFVPEVFGRTE